MRCGVDRLCFASLLPPTRHPSTRSIFGSCIVLAAELAVFVSHGSLSGCALIMRG
jgi:hypothetical protein